ncbi:Transposon Ty3-I Gag-Pol polyprotein [Sesamum angolense]|uniref:Transposon Ty3-I Gag-Pol polyprotein n=1 Tax=Sesamum angolense TaxID=2727404 RepID=A0AAE1W2M4_9LAMI|nr:Transposon Ty3-I Gag-Pol polyprotein [Sesamum angolense]
MMTDPVLALPDMSQPFTVETDASDFALGGVLMQDGHSVAFESRKLKDVEWHYSVHEKELLAVVHCLRLWRHYLLCSPFVVKTDNVAVSHFMSQPKLTSRQARWQELLSEFHFVLEYRAASSNHMADALSGRADLATLGAGPGPPRRAGQRAAVLARRWTTDDQGKPLVCAERRGLEEITHFRMPRHSLGGTFGRRTHDKADHQKKAGLLQPLPIPKRPWESVSMNNISGLPKLGDLGSIIVVEDRLSKYATFIAAPKHVTKEGTAHLFFKHVVKYWGLPKNIVGDRDSRFTGVFWTELFRILGSTLFMSSSYYPQSDGQTERFNSMLEEYLRHFVRGTQKDWVKLLDVAQLCFNAQKRSSTNKSAFEIITGQQPLLPHTLDSPQGVRSPLARSFSQEWKQNVEIARSCLEKAQKRMKKYAYNNHRFVEFNAGDLVMVKRLPCEPVKEIFSRKGGRSPQSAQRPQLELTKTKEKVAEAILNHRVSSTTKHTHNEYLVKWKGCSSEENTWERVTNLKAFLPLVEAYHASHVPRTSPSQVGENVKGRPHSRHP